jgi:hypothetical protein
MFVREERVNSPIKAAKPRYGPNSTEGMASTGPSLACQNVSMDGVSARSGPHGCCPQTIFHTTKPDDFQFILNRWVAVGKSVGELANSVKDIASFLAAISALTPSSLALTSNA